MLNHTFTFNGRCSDEFGVKIERMPNLNRSARKFRSSSVPGRNGAIYELENAWEEVTISYEIFAGGNKAGDAVPSFTEIVEWLNSADDYAELYDSYDKDHYRMAVFVEAVEIESFWHKHGRATVTFNCRPERYLANGVQVIEPGDMVNNPTNHIAKPIITLTGSGAHSLYPVDRPLNDVSLTDQLNFSARLSDYMGWFRYAQYSSRGVYNFYAISSGGTVSAQDAEHGRIAFSPYQVTPAQDEIDRGLGNYCGLGTAVELTPGAYYTLTCNAVSSGQNRVTVWYFASNASHYLTSGRAYKTKTGAGKFTMTFKVPTNSSIAMIVFERPDGTPCTFSSIMLSAGSAEQTFRPYVEENTNSFTLGSRTLRFVANGFEQTVIDCERENIAIDGVDANMNSTVLDEDSNLSVEYLQLDKGSNEVDYSSDITEAIIDPRLWEL